MRIVAALVVAPLLLSGCGGGKKPFIPPGTYAGSTAADRAFTLDVGEKVTVNKREGRFTDRGVVQVKDHGIVTTVTCKVTDRKGEELRCEVRTAPPGTPIPATEVIDLMLL